MFAPISKALCTKGVSVKVVLLVSIVAVLAACSSTNRQSKYEKAQEESAKIMRQALLPELKKKDLDRYIELFGQPSCKHLIKKAAELAIIPKIVNRKEVLIVAHTGEEMKFKFADTCPKESHT